MSDNFSEKKPNQPDLIAFTIENGEEKNLWHNIGAGWPTKNKGWSVKVDPDAIINNRIVLLPREELERMRAERKQSNEQIHDRGHKL